MMHHIRAFIIAYIFNTCLIFNNRAMTLSYVHKKRELNFNNYPVNRPIVNGRDYNNFYPANDINDPGYTKQNENVNNENTPLHGKNINTTNFKSYSQFVSPNGQMFNLLYMAPNTYREQQFLANQQSVAYQHLNNNFQNLAYAGPHLFPTQPQNNYESGPHSNLPIKNINTISNNIYPNQILLGANKQNHIKDSKVATKMEAPFIPSQFLGYGQQQFSQLSHQHISHPHQIINTPQHQQLPKQSQQYLQQSPHEYQHLSPQNLQLSHQNQQLHQQVQQPIIPPIQIQLNPGIKPVHEDHQVSPHHSNNLIYMAPNNIYGLYRHPN